MQQNISEAQEALVSKPLFATSVERLLILNEIKTKYRHLPQPLAFSATLSELLSRVSVPLADCDLIAGRCVDRELSPDEEEIFAAFCRDSDHPKKRVFLSSGHCTYSWEQVVELGLPGLRALAAARLAKEADPEKRIFLQAVLDIYAALAAYLLRYAKAAAARGMTELAENLTAAATMRPDRFAVALQLLWSITLVNCAYITENPTLTVGRLDQILYPLYRADLARGVLTPERAVDYITDYYCKHNLIMGRGEHQVGDQTNSTTFSRICCFDAPQYLLLGGSDGEGNDAVNELTVLFAKAIVPDFKNPVVVVRYRKGMECSIPCCGALLPTRR